ncbi:response regulator [Pseudorhodoferax sp.]|uniref:response regulator n=1 Tax=Pseudorhodoferax sp. TaxID=1993553 RepID=UPI002DD6831B|nr:response regulator [Pseudorhodoferax sp.]
MAKSVIRRMTVLVLLISVLVACASAAFQIYSGYRAGLQALDTQFRNIESSHVPALAANLWVMDQGLVDKQIEGIARLPGIVGVRVAGGHAASAAAVEPDTARRHLVAREFPLRYPDPTDSARLHQIGTLQVEASLDDTVAALRRTAVTIVIAEVLRSAALALAVILALRHYVTRHLAQIANHSANLSLDRLDEPLRLTGGAARRQDEIGALADAIERMRLSLRAEIARREETESRARELVIEKEAAERSSVVKGAFLASMSHEIRTPLNAVIGMSGLALKTELSPRQQNYIEKVHRSAKGLLGIINDILDFSKIEAGKLGVEQIVFRLDQVLDDLASQIGLKAEEKGLELVFDVAGDLPLHVLGDPLRLGQVLTNLGSNAVKFTERGEIVVAVRAQALDDARVELHFSVRDTGIGMAPEQCARVFESFSQADSSTSRKYGGTGLGMAISRRLVELMHGRIWVESVPGQGTTFHVSLPLGLATAEADTHRMPLASELAGLRALVVDDHAIAREIAAEMARALGLDVGVADGGASALQAVQQAAAQGRPFALLLVDWKMPDIDGIDLLAQLRQQGAAAQACAAVMVTAYAREDALAAAGRAGVELQGLVTKPLTPSVLLDAIGTAIGRRVAAPAGAAVKPADGGPASLRGARVLLVEDNALNRELAVELLEGAGVAVVHAEDGEKALRLLRGDADFDGILMDCQMPGLDGFDTTLALRGELGLTQIPVLAMTANVMADERARVLQVGMNDHIAKPIDVDAMFTTMARWIRPAAGRAAQAVAQAQPAAPAVARAVPRIQGLDTDAALRAMGGDPMLYRKMLARFALGQGDFVAEFRAAIDAGDLVRAVRLAHTLRGTAGTIGALAVAQGAGALEQACKGDAPAPAWPALLDTVAAGLAPLVTAIEGLAPNEDDMVASDADPRELVRRLRQALVQGDAEALDLAQMLQAAVRGEEATVAAERLARSAEAYDFEQALNELPALERLA